jgi:hypothetical protein
MFVTWKNHRMKTKTHFQFRLDRWDAASENNLDHIAGIDDFGRRTFIYSLLALDS